MREEKSAISRNNVNPKISTSFDQARSLTQKRREHSRQGRLADFIKSLLRLLSRLAK